MAVSLRTRYKIQAGPAGPVGLTTFYWDGTGASDVALVTEAHARVRAAFAALAARLIAGSGFIIDQPNGDFFEETTGQVVSQAAPSALPAGVTFTNANDPLPYQTQAYVRYFSGTFINGRRVSGKTYIPGWTELDNASGTPSGPAVTALNAFCTALGTTVVTPMSQRIWHRPGGAGAGLTVPVLSRTASGTWGVLRSRRT